MAKTLRSLPADPSKWTPEQLAELDWNPDNLTPPMFQVRPDLELVEEVVKARRPDSGQGELFGWLESADPWRMMRNLSLLPWPSYPHLKQLYQAV